MINEEEFELELEAKVHETVWIRDPAFDIDSTDIHRWYETGEGYVIKPKEKASMIQWRTLEPLEKRQAMINAWDIGKGIARDGGSVPHHALAKECARFGIISFDGLRLDRTRFNGVLGLSDHSLAKLTAKLFQVENGKELGGDALPERFWMLDWLGGLISVDTFRNG